MGEEVFPWLKSIPLAPEYHPTVNEFLDPIAYIFKIEEEASKYGICKIVPPVSALPRTTIIANLNQSLSGRSHDSSPTFTTRVQRIGFCSRQHRRPVQKSVWQSGETYTLPQFEAKAKNFEKFYLKKGSNSKKGLSELEVETLYWKAQTDKPFTIEYANDMPGSAFHRTGGECGTVAETQWNMGVVSRAKGSPLRFIKGEIPGVTSPMVYIAMLFSWFAWHVEDHDLHSLNYMHMGAGKTWYGVPSDAAVAFEDAIRTYGYGGEINSLVTYATLAEKTTIMSPEVLLKAGVPCCRLVQNVGEFVVTFPRAYHSGFSHGFNCAEAVNIATPRWLRFAQDAAIRRTSINYAPLVSHSQLLYDFALSLSSSIEPGPWSSRLKDKLKAKGEALVKRQFLQDMVQNNKLLHVLGKGSPIVVQPIKTKREPGIFSCVTCGVLCHACVAIIQPTKAASCYLMSVDGINLSEDANVVDPKSCSGQMSKITLDGLFDVPIKSFEEMQVVDDSVRRTSHARKYEVNSSLGILALVYGDSSDHKEEEDVKQDILVNYSSNFSLEIRKFSNDQIGCFDRSKSNNFFMESNSSMAKFECNIGLPHTEGNPSSDDDSSMVQVFCLHHAVEVEKRLRSIGGIRILLVCHQDYPKLDAEARLVDEEMGTNHIWNEFVFRNVNKDGEEMIQLAIDNDKTTHINRDWVVKLGMDIFYSASLGRSPLYAKQMPYNSVINNAFAHSSLLSDPSKTRPLGRQKNIVVTDKWCVKERETSVSVFSRVNIRKKEKNVLEDRQTSVKAKFPKELEFKQHTGSKKLKKACTMEVKEDEREFSCDIDGCEMSFDSKEELMVHKRNVCLENGCGKTFFSHKYLMQHRRVHINERPLLCPWKGGKMSFKWAWARTEHVRVHTGARPYLCTKDGCGKTFRFVSDFSRHKRKTGHSMKKQES